MTWLRIHLFGGIRAELDGCQLGASLGRSLSTLLAYLASHCNKLHSREVLASLLWPDVDERCAKRSLNTALWRLRRAIEPHEVPRGSFLVTNSSGDIGLFEEEVFIDTAVFERDLRRLIACPSERDQNDGLALNRTLALYSDDALQGLYDDWAIQRRAQLRDLYVTGLRMQFDQYVTHDDYARAVLTGSAILRLDSLQEDVHRQLMRLYVMRGNRALALRQYEACARILQLELGVSPSPETQQFRSRVLTESPPGGASEASLLGTLGEIRRLLDLAERQFCSSRPEENCRSSPSVA